MLETSFATDELWETRMVDDPIVGAPVDATLAKRARIRRWVTLGKRVGYGLFAYAVVAFVIGATAGFSVPLVDTIVAAMAIGSVALIPAIVFGYGIKAAEREERQQAAAAAASSDGRRPR